MKKCDHMQVDEEYPMCYKASKEGIYGVVVKKECYSRKCYVNTKEERKQKLNKIYEKSRYNGSQNEKIGNS